MLVVFSPIFVADTKIIFRYDFVVLLSKHKKCIICLETIRLKIGEKYILDKYSCFAMS